VNDGQRSATVVLSGNDNVVNAQAVRCYLTTSSVIASPGNDKANENACGIQEDVETNHVKEAAGTSRNTSVSGSGLQVIWFERFHHGQTFDFETVRSAVIKIIRLRYGIYGHASDYR
jgi:hypothetical protein